MGIRRSLSLVTLGASLLLIAGCGGSASDGGDASAATVPATKGPKLKIVHSDYGDILANGRGRALYLFTADHGKGSACSGDCATAWPPYIVKSAPSAVGGAKTGLVGTTRRDDGRLQATYAGHPVYFYEGDHAAGEVNCQAASEFGGYWYVVRSNGSAVR